MEKIEEILPEYCPFITVCGRRGSGKTNFVQNLINIKRFKNVPVYLFSTTEDENDYNPEKTYNTFDEYYVNKLIDENTDKIIILDDVCHQKQVHSSQGLIRLATNGRHKKCTVILICHHYKQVCPSIRGNIDICVTYLIRHLVSLKELLIDHVAMPVKESKIIYDEIMQIEHSCMVINDNARDLINYFEFKAPLFKQKKQKKPIILNLDFQENNKIMQPKSTNNDCYSELVSYDSVFNLII